MNWIFFILRNTLVDVELRYSKGKGLQVLKILGSKSKNTFGIIQTHQWEMDLNDILTDRTTVDFSKNKTIV